MLDLLILTEMLVFSLLVYDQATMVTDAAADAKEPADSISMTEELLSKFDSLVISEEANVTNGQVAQSLLSRKEQGIYESLNELISVSLIAYPDEERAANVLVQLSEHILLKAITSPLNLHL